MGTWRAPARAHVPVHLATLTSHAVCACPGRGPAMAPHLLVSPSPGRALSSDFSWPPLAGCVVSVGEKPPTPTVPHLSVETGAVTPPREARVTRDRTWPWSPTMGPSPALLLVAQACCPTCLYLGLLTCEMGPYLMVSPRGPDGECWDSPGRGSPA